MAINFPATPTLNQTYTFNGRTWTYNGVGWQATGASGLSVYTKTDFTATAAQTTFTVAYTVGFVDVYYNGSKLSITEYTATNGTSVVLGTACAVNDIVETVAWTVSTTLNPALGVASATSLAIGGATIGSNALAVTGTSTFSSTVTHSGATTLSGALTYGGVTLSNAVTGTGNMVLSAAPTMTGTLTIDALTAATNKLTVSSVGVGMGTSPNASYALIVNGAGFFNSAFTIQGALNYGGVTLSNSVTGTGSMVLSASPTLTGTLTGAAATFSSTLGVTGASITLAPASGNSYIYSKRASQSTGQVAFQLSGGTSGTDWIIYQPTSSNNLTFFGNSADRMTLDTNGNLGIGMTPSNRLDITQTTNGFAGAQITNSSAGASAYTGYQLNNGTITGGIFLGGTGNPNANIVEVSASGGGSVRIQPTGGSGVTQFYSNGSESARIDASGNLLVGTTGVTGGLNGKVINVFGSSTVRNIVQTTGQYASVNVGSGGTSVTPTTSAFLYTDGTNNDAHVGTTTSTPLVFDTGGTERARFDTSGNLLVGTTSSSSPFGSAGFVKATGFVSKTGGSKALAVSNAVSNVIEIGSYTAPTYFLITWKNETSAGGGNAQYGSMLVTIVGGASAATLGTKATCEYSSYRGDPSVTWSVATSGGTSYLTAYCTNASFSSTLTYNILLLSGNTPTFL